MADVEIKCTRCGTVVVVSEFADVAELRCRSCGEKLQRLDMPLSKRRLAVRKPAEEDTGREEDAEPYVRELPPQPHLQRMPSKRRLRMSHSALAWIIFVVLGAVSGGLRYGGLLPADDVAFIKEHAIFVVLGLHALITLRAFEDSVFHGTLCLLVPLYSFYFLFSISDFFYLRAVTAGMLLGLGADSAVTFSETAVDVIESINAWIQSGG
jgi:hypothetical protein